MKQSRRNFLASIAVAAALPPTSFAEASPALRPAAALAQDPLRPQYHLLPARNWMNDPNGPIFWKGKYHMFFQYNPGGAIWGDMHWAHAVSMDMIHWKHLPVALAPTPGGPDADGVFSGTAFVQDGRVGMMFTGVRKPTPEEAAIRGSSLIESQCIAMADNDELTSFTKVKDAVIAAPPSQFQTNGFRDPSPWKQGDWWYTPIASGIAGAGGAILLYRSRDLRQWEFVHVFAQRQQWFEAYTPWDVWECPEFFPLGDRHVLIYSTYGKAFWQTGRFDAERLVFHPERQGILDHGSFYAPKTQLDAHGNRILWGWIQEARSSAEYDAAGWSGMMSLPRVLTIADDGTLRYRVADEALALRKQERSATGATAVRVKLENCCGEALYRVRRGDKAFRIVLRSDRTSDIWVTVSYDPTHSGQIQLDYRPFETSSNGISEIHLHVDGSLAEIIVDGQIAWSRRFYYKGAQQAAVLQWEGDVASLLETKWWQMKPISTDRLTT